MGRRRTRVRRRDRRALVLQHRPRPRGARRCRGASDARARFVPHVRTVHEPARRGARATCRGSRAARGCEGVHHGRRRLGRDRHSRKARPRVLERLGPAGEAGHRLAQPRLPRRERVRHVARRDPGERGAVRAARERRGAGPVGRRRRSRNDRRASRRRARRRLRLRARRRCGRRAAAAARLPRPRRGDLPGERRPPHRRRGDHRLRPSRRMVRQRALRHPSRPDHCREGHHVRVRSARRRDRRAGASPSRSGSRAARSSCATATRTRATRPRARSRSRTSTCSSRSGSSSGSASSSRVLDAALRPLENARARPRRADDRAPRALSSSRRATPTASRRRLSSEASSRVCSAASRSSSRRRS